MTMNPEHRAAITRAVAEHEDELESLPFYAHGRREVVRNSLEFLKGLLLEPEAMAKEAAA